MSLKFTCKQLLFGLFLLASASLSAQRTLYIKADSNVTSATANATIRVKNIDSATALQGTITWDTTYLKYKSIAFKTNPNITFNAGSVNVANAATSGQMTFAWTEPSANFVGEPDTTILFTLTFDVKGQMPPASRNASVCFDLSPTINTPCLIAVPDPNTVIGNDPNAKFLCGNVAFPPAPFITQNANVLTANVATGISCTYQWVTGNPPFPIFGANSATYTFTSAGVYGVVITYPNGLVDTASFAATVPVKLSGFNGKIENKTSLLTWVSATEINAKEFQVERSLNGKEFSFVASVKAKGTASTYNFNDKVQELNGNVVYYRLKVVDNDGSFTYSSIIKLAINSNTFFKILNNPVVGGVLKIQGENLTQVRILDVAGKVVSSMNASANNNQEVNVANLKAGVYFIQATNKLGQVQTEKWVK